MLEPEMDSSYKYAVAASDASELQTPQPNSSNTHHHRHGGTGSLSEVADTDTQRSIDSQQDDNSETLPAAGAMELLQQMELEKERYPGAATWAEDEERLFEMFFLRQELPMLPPDWALDFRGVPISEANFTNKMTAAPLIYAHARQNRAAAALVQLVELTASIRTTSESGLHHRVPYMIKDGLHRFLTWAAEDGGYRHLRVVPNIIVEVVDASMQQHAISELMQGRMRALGRLQREFLRADRDPQQFWDGLEASDAVEYLTPVKPRAAAALDEKNGDYKEPEERKPIITKRKDLLLQQYLSRRQDRLAKRYRGGWLSSSRGRRGRQRRQHQAQRPSHPHSDDVSMDEEDELASTTAPCTPSKDHQAPRRRSGGGFASPATTPTTEPDELATPASDASRSEEVKKGRNFFTALFGTGKVKQEEDQDDSVEYRRPLPVVYGLFILNTSVFILTADSALGDTGYVSFHVETDFMEYRQSVWNALTLGLVACQARDELRRRLEDFEPREDWDDESDCDL